ncbi:MAG: DEAD/DEAH box helicase [Gammaproteobacteria bacterium]|nr:DEAD/DEAH box helicase [Gammaproteobacteria bacterium]
MPLASFHPATARWFAGCFAAPTRVQTEAWPVIRAGQAGLIAAPTGSGKTLAAFLAAIDQLLVEGLAGRLPDETRILYISPLKALSNDIHKNLELPLNGIRDKLLEMGLDDVPITARVRSGDTTPAEREAMKRTPPHILVTTPESLYILLTSDSGREMLRTVRSVIVDEIHALAGNKRGAHLSLSLQRLEALCARPPVRIGLSATQKPVEGMAAFLTGFAHDDPRRPCRIIDTGHVRERDIGLEVTGSPLEAVMANEVWGEIYDRLAQLAEDHRTTLIFVNTRRLAERAAAALAERLGEAAVTSHHGSLAKEHRLDAEQRLKQGSLRALVATASLELGIDIGDVDLVCQIGSPHSIATFLQRVGRAGHAVDAIPKGRLFPLSRDDLVECTALLDAIQRDELDVIHISEHPLDVLAQQIVAEVAGREWDEAELYQLVRGAWPYRQLSKAQFTDTVKMLSEGFHTRRGRHGAYLHRDGVHGRLRPRKGARLTALLNGGAIPDQFDYDVIMQPQGVFVGTLNEDFAFESMPGDIFQLGNQSYRIMKIEQGKVLVEDAHGQPPNIPFWFGEAPGRTDELSVAVSRLRKTLDEKLSAGQESALRYLQETLALPAAAAEQLVSYLAAVKAALTVIPTREHLVFERFFDETGDMHFVIHSPYGSRINRAWGLALRKRFCRRFNFELQAAATEDNLILSLGPTHSFPLDEPAGYLKSATVTEILIQALLDAPMFPVRWRWVTNTSLAVPRNRAGKKVPAPFQRNNAEDLIALIFPDQLACFENIQGDREVPDHPLVNQVLADCLHELMDIDGLMQVLQGIETGAIRITTRDLATPSPLALEIINARPYAFLDDGAAEERRTLAINQQRHLDPVDAAQIGSLDPDAINKVKQEAWPQANSPDELHDALMVLGFITAAEGEREHWQDLLQTLQGNQRAAAVMVSEQSTLWVAAERLHQLLALFPTAVSNPIIVPTEPVPDDPSFALVELLRSRLEGLGPVTAAQLNAPLARSSNEISFSLLSLQQEGFAIQGQFAQSGEDEWCERGLLARIHRYTVKRLRNEIEPVSPAELMQFLFHWHGFDEPATGEAALERTLQQLEGIPLAAVSWERDILPLRIDDFTTLQLDRLCLSGRYVWLRLQAPTQSKEQRHKSPAVKSTPISFVRREHLADWRSHSTQIATDEMNLSSHALKVFNSLKQWGAGFAQELQDDTRLLPVQLEAALGELAAWGLITSDGFSGLRNLITPQAVLQRRSKRRPGYQPLAQAGRWSLLRPARTQTDTPQRFDSVEHIARVLLDRYGVVFRKLLENETGLPAWRELLYIYRRMEARGELRGGRFVQGFAGEQFALPNAMQLLRKIRHRAQPDELITIAATDPLNLTGIITPGQRVARQANNRILYRAGVPIAVSMGGEVSYLETVAPALQWEIKTSLLRQTRPEHFHPGPPRPT